MCLTSLAGIRNSVNLPNKVYDSGRADLHW